MDILSILDRAFLLLRYCSKSQSNSTNVESFNITSCKNKLCQVVVVTLNYRLGFLGFLKTEERGMGNFGLLDILAALHWIQVEMDCFHVFHRFFLLTTKKKQKTKRSFLKKIVFFKSKTNVWFLVLDRRFVYEGKSFLIFDDR